MCCCVRVGVIRWWQCGHVRLWRLPSIIKRPEECESERHGDDLSHTDGHAQETQHLQLLRPTDEGVDLWTTALKQTHNTHVRGGGFKSSWVIRGRVL